jgi:hypothetical protein
VNGATTAANLQAFAKNNLALDFPTAPTFTLGDIGQTGMDPNSLAFSFYLINKDDSWLHKNFQFLHAFFAGTQWLQLPGGFIKRNKCI